MILSLPVVLCLVGRDRNPPTHKLFTHTPTTTNLGNLVGLRDEGSRGGVEHIYDTVYDTTTNLGDLEGLSDEGSTRGVEHFRLRVA